MARRIPATTTTTTTDEQSTDSADPTTSVTATSSDVTTTVPPADVLAEARTAYIDGMADVDIEADRLDMADVEADEADRLALADLLADVEADDVPDSEPTDPFLAAVEAARDTADLATGTLNAVGADAVRNAFVALNKTDRETAGAIVGRMLIDATAAVATDGVFPLAFAANLRTLVDSARAEKTRKIAPIVDPVPAAIVELHALTLARMALADRYTSILASLSESQAVDAASVVRAVTAGEMVPDDSYKVILPKLAIADDGTVSVAVKAARAATSGPRAERAPGAGTRDLAADVSAYLSAHGPAKYGAIAASIVASAGAIRNAVEAGRVAGWAAGTVDAANGAVQAAA